MNVLIVKLNATGDVVRTTALLRRLEGSVTWITAKSNVPLLAGAREDMRVLAWEDRAQANDRHYDLVISLEDEAETAAFDRDVRHARVFGASLATDGSVQYSDDAHEWFDMSLISRLGRQRADELKLVNRRTYQEMIFAGLGYRFGNDAAVLSAPVESDLRGEVVRHPWPDQSGQ